MKPDSDEPSPKLRMAPKESTEELSQRFEREQRITLGHQEEELSKSLAPFRVGSVRYLNAVPLTRGLEDQVIFDDSLRGHFLNTLAGWRGRASVAVMSDYGYGGVSPALMTEARSALADGASPVMILPSTACGVLPVNGGSPTNIS